MSSPTNKEKPETVKARNAQPKRAQQRSAQGSEWYKKHPEGHARALKKYHDREKQGYYADILEESFQPILFESDNVAVTSDWHIPFTDDNLVNQLLNIPREHGTTDLIIAGDMWDCDIYSRFTHISPPAVFDEECDAIRSYLKRLMRVFTNIYICRGNHEKRFIDLNAGRLGIKELFALARPSNISEDTWDKRVHITRDDHINFIQNGQMWLSCHPKNFRILNLSVARDIASKHLCNCIIAHGHQWAQGRDRSGKFTLLDGGGMFDKNALAYQRDTTCYPTTRSGFYVIKEGKVIPYEGK